MKTFEQLRRYIKENIPDPFKTKNGESPDFGKNLEKAKSKGLKTYKQKSLNLYKSGGPFVPEKEVVQKTGKTVKMEKKPYFGKPTLPQKTQKAPDRKGLKQAISDVRAGEKRLYDAGVGKKPSLVQQRKFTLSKIKQLSRQTTLKDKLYGSTNVGGGGASGSTKKIKPKTVTPTKGVKQAEVSKKAKEFTKGIEQAKKAKTNKVVDLATKKQQSKLSQAAKNIIQQRDDAIVKRQKLRSATGKKDVKAIRLTNRKVGELDKLAKQTQKAASGVGNPNAPVKYNKMTQGTDFIKKNRKSNTKLVTKTASKNPIKKTKVPKEKVKLPKFGTGARKYATQRGADTAFGKSTVGKLAKKVGFKPSYGLRKVATTAVKKGGLPAVVGLGLLSSPYARTAIKTALVGGGLSAFKSKKEPVAKLDKEKKIGKTVKFSLSPKQKA